MLDPGDRCDTSEYSMAVGCCPIGFECVAHPAAAGEEQVGRCCCQCPVTISPSERFNGATHNLVKTCDDAQCRAQSPSDSVWCCCPLPRAVSLAASFLCQHMVAVVLCCWLVFNTSPLMPCITRRCFAHNGIVTHSATDSVSQVSSCGAAHFPSCCSSSDDMMLFCAQ